MSNETARWFLGYPHPITKTQPDAGTSSWPSWISHFTGSFVGHSPSEMLCPPALGLKRERTEGRKREKFYIYSDVTHTHPARAGSTLKGKRKKKADTRRAKGQKQRRGGGEQTDLRNQPTRRNGPDQNSART